MGRRRRVVLLAVTAVALLTATSGYTAVTGERAVSVSVVDDDDAYVGFVDEEPTATAGREDGQKTILEVQNRFGATVSVHVMADDSTRVNLSLIDQHFSVDSGETVSVEGTVACDESVDAPVTVPVTLSVDSDTGVHAEIDREVTVRCEPPQTETESDADEIAEETEGGAESDELNNETESDDDETDDEGTDEEADGEDESDGETEDGDESDDRTDQTET